MDEKRVVELWSEHGSVTHRQVMAFARAIEREARREERERCAKVCESQITGDNTREDREAKLILKLILALGDSDA